MSLSVGSNFRGGGGGRYFWNSTVQEKADLEKEN